MKYTPMTREQHLERGKCCGNGCVYCPWYTKPVRPWVEPDPRIVEALKSGETVTVYSDRKSLVPSVTLQGRVTVVYKRT